MNLKKRDCPIKMSLTLGGAGWSYVCADFGQGGLSFTISYTMDDFETLIEVLYGLHPDNKDPEEINENLIDYKYGICEHSDDGYKVVSISDTTYPGCVFQKIPYLASFTWDEEGCSYSKWTFEREPTQCPDFNVRIGIEVFRDDKKEYSFEAKYSDICYAVASAYTAALKKHGIWGYHHSVFYRDANMRRLLFLKCVALDNYEARKLTWHKKEKVGEASDFQKEIELLLFDM